MATLGNPAAKRERAHRERERERRESEPGLPADWIGVTNSRGDTLRKLVPGFAQGKRQLLGAGISHSSRSAGGAARGAREQGNQAKRFAEGNLELI